MLELPDLQQFSSIITAIATCALVYVTFVLARTTKSLSEATNQPLVTATLEPNQWSLVHYDMIVANGGNAPAFDVRVKVHPQIAIVKPGRLIEALDVLRPGQAYSSYVARGEDIVDAEFDVEVSWKKSPAASSREKISYKYHMKNFYHRGQLGEPSPMHQIAREIRKMREYWHSVAAGQRALHVNAVHKTSDRESRDHQELNDLFSDEELSQPSAEKPND